MIHQKPLCGVLRLGGSLGGDPGFLVVVLVFVLGGTLLAGCGRSRSGQSVASSESIAANTDRFPHKLHTMQSGGDERITNYKGRGLACDDCHPAEDVEAGRAARPGGNQHAPCDECHRDEFYKPPGAFCRNCHVSVNLAKEGATKMHAFPARGSKRVLASNFSHEVHLDDDEMESAVGFHVSCEDCHSRDAKTGDPLLPRHKACARCHEGKAKKVLAMADCKACHLQDGVEIERGRVMITEGLIFSHGDHVKDRAGADIGCVSCHAEIRNSRTVKDFSIPKMQECAKCHQDPARTPERVRIARCEVCHEGMVDGNTPRTHLNGSSLPEDHSLEFRTNHAEQAADKDANCQYCHENLSGNSRDSCFQCHEVMRPKDHMLGWRNDSHGREAALNRDRCASCHQADYCTACHSIPPRSHQPLGEFRLGGHAQTARFGLSSCMACHTYEDTCSRCHRSQR